ncbi:AlpA family phage regulatory protein [Psychrobacter raelei]|uniref:AlpA family phage regulatory protein n=1 Tax=Psychrobacter raelei TaxID=2565531 RepID=A0AAT9PBP5_9GAMM|nr:AlpA family phage regulatory protein [Psychrobacter sp. PraFG1]UNK04447.1 AlpA family phage regulatory protein [Psychrobacter sp. PraFG1]
MTSSINTEVINFNQNATKDIKHAAPSQYAKYLPPQGMSRAKDILPFLPFGRTTLHEWSNNGLFPASIKLSPTMVAWRNSDVLEWLENQKPSTVSNDDLERA